MAKKETKKAPAKKAAAKKAAAKKVVVKKPRNNSRTKKSQVSGMPGLDALKNLPTGSVDQSEHLDSLTANS